MTTTLAVMACFALVATFMGLITDPVQEWLGRAPAPAAACHRHARARGAGRPRRGLGLPDPYLARVTDLADVALMAMRLTR